MKKSLYIVLGLCIILVVITVFSTKKKLDNNCQIEEMQINQKKPEKEKIYLSPEEYFILPFMIINNENGQRMLNYEEEFIQNIENIKKAHLQRNVITEYITNASDKKNLLSEVEETQFYELSPEEKLEILDANNTDATYRFGDDLEAMKRRKIYRFGAFQLALCGTSFGVGISCVNERADPFQIIEQGSSNTFTGALIRKIGETQRHSLLLPQIGNHPVSMWVKNGRLFLAIYTVPEGEYFGANDWYGAIYTLEKVKGNEEEAYARVFQQCYDTAYKAVSWEYILGDDSGVSGAVFWDNWLFTEDTLVPPRNCFF